jgi:hypothetical protein
VLEMRRVRPQQRIKHQRTFGHGITRMLRRHRAKHKEKGCYVSLRRVLCHL